MFVKVIAIAYTANLMTHTALAPMTRKYQSFLESIRSQQNEMCAILESWANINSGSENIPGLHLMLAALQGAFIPLGGKMNRISLPPRHHVDAKGQVIDVPVGDALHIIKRPEASIRVFLGGHMDTVYGSDSSFQTVERIDKNKMRGPGVADMKGGLLIMLKALETLEASPWANNIGWEVLINPDEEVGSSGSEHLFIDAAKRCHVGLIFEPAFSDGALVSARKGSANFTIVSRGRAAHSGRDFHSGRNAITALARVILQADQMNSKDSGITLNIGRIQGGGPVNIVPDLAICGLNVRVETSEQLRDLKSDLRELVKQAGRQDGITMTFHEHSERGPKPFDAQNQALFDTLKECAKKLDISLQWRPSGGVCDGNILSSAGLPNVDTLGAVGGNIHTTDEYILLDSLTERTSLTALYLMKLAAGDLYITRE